MQFGKVVVWAGGGADDVGNPCREIVVEFIELRSEDLRRPLDLARIATDFGAPVVEDAILPREFVRLTLPVPDRRLVGDDLEGRFLTPTADQDWEQTADRTRIQCR